MSLDPEPISPEHFWAVLKRRGYTFIAGVPDSTFGSAYDMMVTDPDIRYVPAVREDVALGVASADAPRALFELAAAIGAPTSLESIGVPADGLDEAARRILTEAAGNVRTPDEASIRQMLDDAFHGRTPA